MKTPFIKLKSVVFSIAFCSLLFGTATTVKAVPPVITEVTPVTTPTTGRTATYVFNSTQAGTIRYSNYGDAKSTKETVVAGENTIVFDITVTDVFPISPLCDGDYKNAGFCVKNDTGEESNFIHAEFVVELDAPEIYEVNAVSAITSDVTPEYVFYSNEAGEIVYSGSCTGTTTDATVGYNRITFNTLSPGATYSDCTVKVVDAFGNESNIMDVSVFTVAKVPTIDGVTGTINDGETITIGGSGFRTKATPVPLRFTDFENGVAGEYIDFSGTSEDWTSSNFTHDGALTFSDEQCRYPDALSAKQDYNTGGGQGFYLSNSMIPGMIPATKELYFSGWFWYKSWGVLSNNVKIVSMGGKDIPNDCNPSVPADNYQSRMGGYESNGHGDLYVTLSEDGSQKGPDCKEQSHHGSGFTFNELHPQESWHRLETYLHIGSKGHEEVYVDGVKLSEVQGPFTPDNSDMVIDYLLIGHWVRTDMGGVENSAKVNRYWDELYVDVTQARVEIGNASTWDACTHREIQIPTEWSEGSIEITLNQGSLDTLQGKYLFVVDADGNPSDGFLLGSATIGIPSVETHFQDVLNISMNANECNIRRNDYSTSMSSGNTLNIYNISGRLVEQLTENNGEFIWNTGAVDNGIYLMKLVGSQNYPGQKFVLIK